MAGILAKLRHRLEPRRGNAAVTAPAAAQDAGMEARAVAKYLAGGRVPFSSGYTVYKELQLLDVLNDEALMARFREGTALPAGYGTRLDERIVEYPFVFARLPADGLILDAGSTLNKQRLLDWPGLKGREIVIYTLDTDWMTKLPTLSYIFGDLRRTILKDDVASCVVCISTLEHVGFTYEYKTYSAANPWPHAEPESHLDAIAEFRRVLTPGGRLLLTVPYGRREDHGWLQQFDAAMVTRVKEHFGGIVRSEVYFRYKDGSWQVTSADECRDLSYFNIHQTGTFEEDGLAAARAVCCLELEKPAA